MEVLEDSERDVITAVQPDKVFHSQLDIAYLASVAAVKLESLVHNLQSLAPYTDINNFANALSQKTLIPKRPYSPAFLTEPIMQYSLSQAIRTSGLHDTFNTATEILEKGSQIARDLMNIDEKRPGTDNLDRNYLIQLKEFCGALCDNLLGFEESAYVQGR